MMISRKSIASLALDRILRKDYPAKVADYAGNLLLVGINYDRKRRHIVVG